MSDDSNGPFMRGGASRAHPPTEFDEEFGPPVFKNRKRVEKIEWDPVFGPPVIKGTVKKELLDRSELERRMAQSSSAPRQPTTVHVTPMPGATRMPPAGAAAHQQPVQEGQAVQQQPPPQQGQPVQQQQQASPQPQQLHVWDQQMTALEQARQNGQVNEEQYLAQRTAIVNSMPTEVRLQKLDEAKAAGHVSEADYATHRQAIIASAPQQQQQESTQEQQPPQQAPPAATQQPQPLPQQQPQAAANVPIWDQQMAALEDARTKGQVNDQQYIDRRSAIVNSMPTEVRLQKLDQARAAGHLSQQDYETHRQGILAAANDQQPPRQQPQQQAPPPPPQQQQVPVWDQQMAALEQARQNGQVNEEQYLAQRTAIVNSMPTEVRLQKLDEAKAAGHVSEADYATHRQAIIASAPQQQAQHRQSPSQRSLDPHVPSDTSMETINA